MNPLLENIRTQITTLLARLNRRQKILIAAAAVALVAVIVVASILLTRTEYRTVYTGLDASEAGEIMARLNELAIPAKAKGTGTIQVPADQADQIVMQLATEGIPQTGLTNDIFSNASGFGTTDMEKQQYKAYQTGEHVRQLLRKQDKIKDATVIINLYDQSPFVLAEQAAPATASVSLSLIDGAELTTEEAKTIFFLVSRSVPNLSEENITIADTKGRQYTLEDVEGVNLTDQRLMTNQVRKDLIDQVISLLSPVFGKEKISAEVNVVLDFDKKVTESVVFSPPVADEGTQGGLEVSLRELSETINGTTESGGEVGADPNGTGVPTYPTMDGSSDQTYSKITREVNREINSIKELIEGERGAVKELSISVIIDNTDSEEDYSTNVKQLLVNAIGVDETRVTVAMMPFQPIPDTVLQAFSMQEDMLQSQQRSAMIRMIILAASIVIAAGLLLLIFMSLRKKQPALPSDEELGAVLDVMAGEDGDDVVLAEIEARRAGSQEAIENFIEKDPEAVAQLLRNWLTDDV